MMPWIGLQCVIEVSPGHTEFLSFNTQRVPYMRKSFSFVQNVLDFSQVFFHGLKYACKSQCIQFSLLVNDSSIDVIHAKML